MTCTYRPSVKTGRHTALPHGSGPWLSRTRFTFARTAGRTLAGTRPRSARSGTNHCRWDNERSLVRAGAGSDQRPRRRRLSREVPWQPVPQPYDRRARPLRHREGHAAQGRYLILRTASLSPCSSPQSSAHPALSASHVMMTTKHAPRLRHQARSI